jgi:hypothetical protein
MKICSMCKIEKPTTEFYTQPYNKNLVRGFCKKCHYKEGEITKFKNKEHYEQVRYKYTNSEDGFLKQKISYIFTPSTIKEKGTPNATKEDFYKYFYDYVEKNGRNCFYCKEPWTYTTKKVNFGSGVHKKQTKRQNLKNLSLDRLDSSKPYNLDNVIFCCAKCNFSKNEVSIKLIKRLYEIITERKL